MHKSISENTNWSFCPDCLGRGKKNSKRRKKSNSKDEIAIQKPKQLQQKICKTCLGTGLIASENPPHPNFETFPKVAIIGGGIGGMALAVACLHRGIPFTVYERDTSFNARSQGYGLTQQQASKSIKGLGISSLEEGVISTKHVVHKTNGEVIAKNIKSFEVLLYPKPKYPNSQKYLTALFDAVSLGITHYYKTT